MSWHYSLALEEAFSEANYLAGKPSAPWSSMPSAADDLCSAKMKDTFHHSPFGTMFAPSTENRGEELLTWFRADSLAKTSAQPEQEPASMENAADSGQKWQGSFTKYDRNTSSWKTAQCSLLGDSDEFSETWPRWGSMQNGESYLRPIPAHLTSENASGLWQTPVADDACNRKSGKWNSRGEPKLSAEVLMWPTPTVCGNYNRKGASKTSGDGLATVVRKWPTPVASMSKGSSPASLTRKSGASRENDRLDHAVMASDGGQLNPNWVEWLMGWPIGWTGCEPLETAKFQEWLEQHGQF